MYLKFKGPHKKKSLNIQNTLKIHLEKNSSIASIELLNG